MAIVKLNKKGYGQLELNQVTFRRDGRIEAQCALDETEFLPDAVQVGGVAENGMLLAVDKYARLVNKATVALAETRLIGLHYSAEKLYDPTKSQLRNFYSTSGDFLPRIGYLAVGDRFHTNTVCYDDAVYATPEDIQEALEADTLIYAGIASDGSGYWELSETAPTAGPVATVAEYATMPDGQIGLKLSILKV